ncbi:uncharacterized protein [Notamacropus eugenii]|uniref:uncharacterized protein n=1 Tax=Notamacropus eugenii TaxID=9315 RepID=UPI003B67DF3F
MTQKHDLRALSPKDAQVSRQSVRTQDEVGPGQDGAGRPCAPNPVVFCAPPFPVQLPLLQRTSQSFPPLWKTFNSSPESVLSFSSKALPLHFSSLARPPLPSVSPPLSSYTPRSPGLSIPLLGAGCSLSPSPAFPGSHSPAPPPKEPPAPPPVSTGGGGGGWSGSLGGGWKLHSSPPNPHSSARPEAGAPARPGRRRGWGAGPRAGRAGKVAETPAAPKKKGRGGPVRAGQPGRSLPPGRPPDCLLSVSSQDICRRRREDRYQDYICILEGNCTPYFTTYPASSPTPEAIIQGSSSCGERAGHLY